MIVTDAKIFRGKSGREYTLEDLKKDYRTTHVGGTTSGGYWHPDVGHFTDSNVGKDQANDSVTIVDVTYRDGRSQCLECGTRRNAVATAARLAMDIRVAFSAAAIDAPRDYSESDFEIQINEGGSWRTIDRPSGNNASYKWNIAKNNNRGSSLRLIQDGKVVETT